MKVICDIETDSLNPTRIWVIVCIDINTGEEYVFTEPDRNPDQFTSFARNVEVWSGHNFIQFDYPTIVKLIPTCVISRSNIIDTLVLSRLLNYSVDGGHSLDAWGSRFNIVKPTIDDFGKWPDNRDEIINRCTVDARINLKLYKHFENHINSEKWKEAIHTEHEMAYICHDMSENGFHFNLTEAKRLLEEITNETTRLEEELKKSFPPKAYAIKEITPRATRFGTINKSDFRWVKDGDLSEFDVGASFTRIGWEEFNPGSSKQIVERLNAAGWKPLEKTKEHIKAEQERDEQRLERFRVYGWKVSETNLSTLPDTAPAAAHSLSRYLLLRSRASDLEEWIGLTAADSRVHGRLVHIGAWTHRMAHQNPNMANIPTRGDVYAKDLRALWSCPDGRLLIGVDAESIQIRILAHYMEDEELIKAITNGADPHEVNKDALGPICRTRDNAKTFIYAWVLGSGIPKVAKILDCTKPEAKEAVSNFLGRFPKLVELKKRQIPRDFDRGYFEAIDGRFVVLPKHKPDFKEHKVLSGYLQAGETIIMKKACILWREELHKLQIPFKQVNFVHDEWQTEVENDMKIALKVAEVQADAIRKAGELYQLKCPLAGSFVKKKKGEPDRYTIGNDWAYTH